MPASREGRAVGERLHVTVLDLRQQYPPDDSIAVRVDPIADAHRVADLLAQRVEGHRAERDLVGRSRRAPGDDLGIDPAPHRLETPTDHRPAVDVDILVTHRGDVAHAGLAVEAEVGAVARCREAVVGCLEVPRPTEQVWRRDEMAEARARTRSRR